MKVLTKNNKVILIDGDAIKKSEPTVMTKNITENGIYNAVDDNVDGYNIVNVNVSGGLTYDLLYEFDITGTTSSSLSIAHNFSQYWENYDALYLQADNVTIDVGDWLYAGINGNASKYFNKDAKTLINSDKFMICQRSNTTNQFYYYLNSSSNCFTTPIVITSLTCKLYNSGATVTGGKIKLYGLRR